jgi:hypothetical protein
MKPDELLNSGCKHLHDVLLYNPLNKKLGAGVDSAVYLTVRHISKHKLGICSGPSAAYTLVK